MYVRNVCQLWNPGGSYDSVKNSQRYQRTLKPNISLRGKHQSFITALEGIMYNTKIPPSKNTSNV